MSESEATTVETLFFQGNHHMAAGDSVRAEACFRAALQLAPDTAEVHANLGFLLDDQGAVAEAQACYGRAIALNPALAQVHLNFGTLLASHKRLDERYAKACFNLAYVLLRQGRLEEGWQCLEARDWYGTLQAQLDCPRWRGESLAGKSLLIGYEAGHGDMIQFGRYASVLKRQGAARI